MVDYKALTYHLKKRKFEKELDALYGPIQYKNVQVNPPEVCSVCNGTKQTYMEGDAHKSAGIIPCPHIFCRGGMIYERRVEIRRVIRVKANSKKVD